MNAKKQQFAASLQSLATRLALVVRDGADITATYFDRGYAGGAADPLTDADLEGLAYPTTADQVVSMVNMLDNMTKFLSGLEAATGDYMPAINNMRTDQ